MGKGYRTFPIVLLFEKKLKVEEHTCCEGKVGEKKWKVKRRNSTRGYFKSEIRNTEQGDVIWRADLGGTATYNPKLCTKYKTWCFNYTGGSFPKQGKCRCSSPCSQAVQSLASSPAFPHTQRWAPFSSADTQNWWHWRAAERTCPKPTTARRQMCFAVAVSHLLGLQSIGFS